MAQAIVQAEEQLGLDELRSFEEKIYGDIWNKEDYRQYLIDSAIAHLPHWLF